MVFWQEEDAMILNGEAKRLGIFAYFDADGIVDDYVPYLVAEVGKHCAHQVFVVNGILTKESEARVQATGVQLLYRENHGFDITAYREGLLSQDLDGYDEILFYNQTIFGPVCPLDSMFDDMNSRDVDFWGLSRHKGAKSVPWNDYKDFPPHIQSYFFAVRSSMFTDERFMGYWTDLPKIETYWDAVCKHEVRFTEHFAKMGFRWQAYLDTRKDEISNDYPLMGKPAEMLEQGSPFVKRKVFLMDRLVYSTVPQGGTAQETWEYLERCTQYPVRLIAQNITRTATLAEVTQAFVPYYPPVYTKDGARQTAIVLYLERDAFVSQLLAAAAEQPFAQCFVVFADETLCERYRDEMPADLRCLVREGRKGPQVLLEELYGMLNAPYVAYLTNDIPMLMKDFEDETTLRTAVRMLTGGCESVLAQEPCCGILFAPPSTHQDCATLGMSWPEICPMLKQRLHDAGFTIPLGAKAPGIAVRGGMFFARRQVLEPLTKLALCSEDFEGLYPLWEYLVPLSAHQAGYLIGYVADYAEMGRHLTNLSAMLTQTTRVWYTKNNGTFDRLLFRMKAIRDFYYERRFQMTLEQAFEADLTWKQKLWICLQVVLKPETFSRLHPNTGKYHEPPRDPLD